MKLSFSTLGCPDWHWHEIVSAAADLGYDGIEIRGIEKDVFAPASPVFAADRLPAVRENLKKSGVAIAVIDTACALSSNGSYSSERIADTARLAASLGCPLIRVLADATPEPSGTDINEVAAKLGEACKIAAESGVTVVAETNGDYAFSGKMLSLLDAVGAENLGVLWDIQHPVRVAKETVSETVSRLGSHIRHVHVKDSVLENGKTVYKMTGYGDLPIKEAVAALASVGYSGCLSLEWLKRWNRELEDPGIVFAHYIRALRAMM